MAQDQNNLVWIDMEMTGLIPDSDRIIEIAMVVTDKELNVLAEAAAAEFFLDQNKNLDHWTPAMRRPPTVGSEYILRVRSADLIRNGRNRLGVLRFVNRGNRGRR